MKNKKLLSVITTLLLFGTVCSCSGSNPAQSAFAKNSDEAPDGEPLPEEPKDNQKPDIPVEGDYVLVYEEEFDSSIDKAKWRYRTDEKGGGKNLSENVTVSDGKLSIKFDESDDLLTGGGIISRELFGYGYYETKCTLFAEGGGLHSAFWLMGGSGDGVSLPKKNTVFEIDGFEFDSNKPDVISFNLNYKIGRTYGLINKYTVPSLSGREIVCGFEWLPDRISWYLDGKLMHTVAQEDEPLFYAQQALWLTALANDTMSGSVDTSLLPAYTSFDYFRYYAKPLRDVNLIGSSGFEYNANVGIESLVDMQTPLSFCESGDTGASRIEMSADAYAGNCMLVHKSPSGSEYEVRTYQKLYNIPNATYSLSVAAKASGDAEISRVEIEGHGSDVTTLELPAEKEWKIFSLEGIKVTTNTVTVCVHTKGGADDVVCIDELYFASSEGERCGDALYYPNVYIGEGSVGEILVNGKSASFSTSGGWKKSSVIGDEYASWYKIGASADDYAGWKVCASVSGEHEISVYNVQSGGKVQEQKVSVYAKGVRLCSFDTGSKAGWQTLGSITLTEGVEYEIRIENTSRNKTMRADSVKLTPVSTVSYSDCIVMSTQNRSAYVYGVRTNINDVPPPVYDGGTVYLPVEFLKNSAGIDLTGEEKEIDGVRYVCAAALSSVGMKCTVSEDGIVIVCSDDKEISSAVSGAAKDLFIRVHDADIA